MLEVADMNRMCCRWLKGISRSLVLTDQWALSSLCSKHSELLWALRKVFSLINTLAMSNQSLNEKRLWGQEEKLSVFASRVEGRAVPMSSTWMFLGWGSRAAGHPSTPGASPGAHLACPQGCGEGMHTTGWENVLLPQKPPLLPGIRGLWSIGHNLNHKAQIFFEVCSNYFLSR